MTAIGLEDRPRLARHARLGSDPVSGTPILRYPEGHLELNATSEAILRGCDGSATVASILARLAETYEVDAEELRGDVLACLGEMRQRRLLDL